MSLLKDVLHFIEAGIVIRGMFASLLIMSGSVFLTLVIIINVPVRLRRLWMVSSWRSLVMFILSTALILALNI